MLDIGKETTQPTPKCYFTSTTLPAYLDASQQPTRNPPFSLLHSAPYYHTLTLISPSSSSLKLQDLKLKYAKLSLSLLNLLVGDFFNKKIKAGNVLLLSAPLKLENTSSTAEFKLVEGVLAITCDRATYERAGLNGAAIPDPYARKHGQGRFKVELNLRLPSMLAGKKGFERLLHAARTVFTGDITWLYYDVSAAGVKTDDSSLGGNVEIREVIGETEEMEAAMVPQFPTEISPKDDDTVTELLEWLALAAVSSPRIQKNDVVDEIISRYEVPTTTDHEPTSQDLTKTTYTGFLPTSFITDVFAKAVIGNQGHWFGVLVQGFEQGKRFVMLKTEDGKALCWDLEG